MSILVESQLNCDYICFKNCLRQLCLQFSSKSYTFVDKSLEMEYYEEISCMNESDINIVLV